MIGKIILNANFLFLLIALLMMSGSMDSNQAIAEGVCDSSKFGPSDPNYPDSTDWYANQAIWDGSGSPHKIYASTGITLDGILDEKDWWAAITFDLGSCDFYYANLREEYSTVGFYGPTDAVLNVRFVYDNVGLYLGLEFLDDIFDTDNYDDPSSLAFWNDDGFEWTLDLLGKNVPGIIGSTPNSDPDAKYIFKLMGVWRNGSNMTFSGQSNGYIPNGSYKSGAPEILGANIKVQNLVIPPELQATYPGMTYKTIELLLPWNSPLIQEAFFVGGGPFNGYPREDGSSMEKAPAVGNKFKMDITMNDDDQVGPESNCPSGDYTCTHTQFHTARGAAWWTLPYNEHWHWSDPYWWPWFEFADVPGFAGTCPLITGCVVVKVCPVISQSEINACNVDPFCFIEKVWDDSVGDSCNVVINYPEPVLEAIGSPTFERKPLFAWSFDSSVTSYNLQIDDNSNFSSPLFQLPLSDTFYIPTIDLPMVEIYWRVSTDLKPSVYSSVDTFTIQDPNIPVLIAMPEYIYDYRPLFIWNAVPEASSYTIIIDNSSNFSSPLVQTAASDTFFMPLADLPGTGIYWKVKSDNGTTYSSTDYFTIIPDSIPELKTFSGKLITEKRPTLSWELVDSASSYFIQVATDSNFNNLILAAPLADTAFSPLADLSLGTYYWRVSSDLNLNLYSPVDYFTIEEETVANKNVLSDKNKTFSIYPNPFNPEVNITFPNPDAKNLSIKIYDGKGKLVLYSKTSSKHFRWNAYSFPSGRYYVEVEGLNQGYKAPMLLLK